MHYEQEDFYPESDIVEYEGFIDKDDDNRCPICGSYLLDHGEVRRCSFIMCDYERSKKKWNRGLELTSFHLERAKSISQSIVSSNGIKYDGLADLL